jgi:hypothetical protein
MSERGAGDPFAPAAQHEHALDDARERARNDAKRHAEDLLERQLPFVVEAEALGQRRVTLLAQRRDELLTQARRRRSDATTAMLDATQRREAAEAALSAAGVPPEQFALRPLDLARTVKISTCAGACTIVVVAVVLAAAFGSLLIASGLLVCLLLGGSAYATLTHDSEIEHPRVHALRKARTRAATDYRNADSARLLAEDEIVSIPERAQSLMRGEQTFAEELVSAYTTELHSSLPPGALANGATLAAQRKPQVRLHAEARAR